MAIVLALQDARVSLSKTGAISQAQVDLLLSYKALLIWRSLCARCMLPFCRAPTFMLTVLSNAINFARSICCSSLKLLSYNHKAKTMTPATPANAAPLLTTFATPPPFDDADAEAAEADADAVDDDPMVLGAAAEEPEELTGPTTGVGVGLPSANLKFAQARRVKLCAWMTMLRLPKKEFRPGSVET
jgi:hypothetical protein